jgi:hypothetical protein
VPVEYLDGDHVPIQFTLLKNVTLKLLEHGCDLSHTAFDKVRVIAGAHYPIQFASGQQQAQMAGVQGEGRTRNMYLRSYG